MNRLRRAAAALGIGLSLAAPVLAQALPYVPVSLAGCRVTLGTYVSLSSSTPSA